MLAQTAIGVVAIVHCLHQLKTSNKMDQFNADGKNKCERKIDLFDLIDM